MSTTSVLTDEGLVRRCKRELPNGTHSYEMLVSRHMQRVYHLIYCIVQNQQDAEDVMQEVFIKVYYQVHKFDKKALFSTWLYRVTTNNSARATQPDPTR